MPCQQQQQQHSNTSIDCHTQHKKSIEGQQESFTMSSSNLSPDDVTSTSATTTTIGNKRPLNRTGKNGEPLSEKKLRRLEKNRLSARECRRRKREATENLQRQINMLEGENLRLRLQLQVRFFAWEKKKIGLARYS